MEEKRSLEARLDSLSAQLQSERNALRSLEETLQEKRQREFALDSDMKRLEMEKIKLQRKVNSLTVNVVVLLLNHLILQIEEITAELESELTESKRLRSKCSNFELDFDRVKRQLNNEQYERERLEQELRRVRKYSALGSDLDEGGKEGRRAIRRPWSPSVASLRQELSHSAASSSHKVSEGSRRSPDMNYDIPLIESSSHRPQSPIDSHPYRMSRNRYSSLDIDSHPKRTTDVLDSHSNRTSILDSHSKKLSREEERTSPTSHRYDEINYSRRGSYSIDRPYTYHSRKSSPRDKLNEVSSSSRLHSVAPSLVVADLERKYSPDPTSNEKSTVSMYSPRMHSVAPSMQEIDRKSPDISRDKVISSATYFIGSSSSSNSSSHESKKSKAKSSSGVSSAAVRPRHPSAIKFQDESQGTMTASPSYSLNLDDDSRGGSPPEEPHSEHFLWGQRHKNTRSVPPHLENLTSGPPKSYFSSIPDLPSRSSKP